MSEPSKIKIIWWRIRAIQRTLEYQKGVLMSDKHKSKSKCENPEHDCGPDCDCGEHEIEIVELEDENGEKEEFAILDELEFEDRHFVIMAPLAEVQALQENENPEEELDIDLSIEIFEIDDEDNFNVVEDEELAKRLMEYLDKISREMEEDWNEKTCWFRFPELRAKKPKHLLSGVEVKWWMVASDSV